MYAYVFNCTSSIVVDLFGNVVELQYSVIFVLPFGHSFGATMCQRAVFIIARN